MTPINNPAELEGQIVRIISDKDGTPVSHGIRLIERTAFGWGAVLRFPGFYEMLDIAALKNPQWGLPFDSNKKVLEYYEKLAESRSASCPTPAT